MRTLHAIAKYLLGLIFVVTGSNHFIHADFYMQMMPPYLPWHLGLVYLSGFLEIVLGVMVCVPALTRIAAWGLIVLLIAIFPANIHMALHPQLYPAINPLGLWLRLPLQAVLIAWAYCYTGPQVKGIKSITYDAHSRDTRSR